MKDQYKRNIKRASGNRFAFEGGDIICPVCEKLMESHVTSIPNTGANSDNTISVYVHKCYILLTENELGKLEVVEYNE